MWIDAGSFLIGVFFDLYLSVLLLRFILQWVGANYYNPLSQFTVTLTEPLLKMARKLLPAWRGLDLAILVSLILLATIKNGLLIGLQQQVWPYLPGLLLLAVANLLSLICSLCFFVIILRALLSWLQPQGRNPVVVIVYQITQRLLAPLQRLLPMISGIDLSPLVAIILLQLINMVLIQRLLVVAKGIALVGL